METWFPPIERLDVKKLVNFSPKIHHFGPYLAYKTQLKFVLFFRKEMLSKEAKSFVCPKSNNYMGKALPGFEPGISCLLDRRFNR